MMKTTCACVVERSPSRRRTRGVLEWRCAARRAAQRAFASWVTRGSVPSNTWKMVSCLRMIADMVCRWWAWTRFRRAKVRLLF
eukprot:1743209-Rhodomonas_salina.2